MENINSRHQKVVLSFSKPGVRMQKNHAEMSDLALLQTFRRTQDSRWLGYLFQRYTVLVFGVCMKYLKHEEDARDCTQQVFEKAFQEIPKYEISYFKSWVYQVAKNQCLMKLRAKGNISSAITENITNATVQEPAAEQAIQKEKLLKSMEEALQTLSTEQRNCIERFYLLQESYQQISEATGYSLSQIKSYIQNGKRNLKLRLQQSFIL